MHIPIRDQPRAILQAAVARLHAQYVDQDTLQGVFCGTGGSGSSRTDVTDGKDDRLGNLAVIVAARLPDSCFGMPSGACTTGHLQRRRCPLRRLQSWDKRSIDGPGRQLLLFAVGLSRAAPLLRLGVTGTIRGWPPSIVRPQLGAPSVSLPGPGQPASGLRCHVPARGGGRTF